MARSHIALILIGVILAAETAVQPICMGQIECSGKYKGGLRPSPAELTDILKQHAQWVKDGGPHNEKLANDTRRANLCGADLRGNQLSGANLIDANMMSTSMDAANLSHADLNGAYLLMSHLDYAIIIGADLKGAILHDAHLQGAVIYETNLNGADLGEAYLHGARLRGVNLSEADLGGADMSGADLIDASLEGANLTDTNLHGAKLGYADVARAEFDVFPDSIPDAIDIYSAKHLQLVYFSVQPAGLVKLRAEFKGLGMRTQESQLTYAIRLSELHRKDQRLYVHSWFERATNTVFFDWTCQYGLSPGRPVLIGAALAVVLSIVYIFAQIIPGPNGGIWAVWDEHRVKRREGSNRPQQLTGGFPSNHSWTGIFLLALYFSLLSATRIGWRELNVGTWITRIQPREYSLRATGWVRVVSGIQSLVSVYLVALAILTYFGTPFEY